MEKASLWSHFFSTCDDFLTRRSSEREKNGERSEN
jgi:hypothetical protein